MVSCISQPISNAINNGISKDSLRINELELVFIIKSGGLIDSTLKLELDSNSIE